MVNPNTLKMKEMMVCDNLRDLKKLVRFISIVMSVFKETHVYKTTKEVDLLLRNTTRPPPLPPGVEGLLVDRCYRPTRLVNMFCFSIFIM